MLSLGKHKSYRNSKTKKNIKPFDASLTNFQDFINKSLSKPTRTSSKIFSPNKTKMEKLNFSNTAISTSFLPPKSVDKHRFSTTNRAALTFQEDFLKLETPTNKQRSSFFNEKQTQQVQLTHRQIKQKIENNAMQRFQQLFRKQNNVRGKKIEQQQSKRLMGLLEKTSRNNRQNQPQQTFSKPNQPYFATSKKNIKVEQSDNEVICKNQRVINQRIPVTQIKQGLRSIQNGKQVNMESNKLNEDVTENRKNFKFEIKRKNSMFKQQPMIQQLKQTRQKQIVQRMREKQEKKQIDNKVITKKINHEQVQKFKSQQVQKLKSQQVQKIKQVKKQQKVNNNRPRKQNQESNKQEIRNKEQKEIRKKQVVSEVKNEVENKQKQIKQDQSDKQKKLLQKEKSQNLNKEKNKVEVINQNNYQVDNFEIEEVKTFQKVQKKNNDMQLNKQLNKTKRNDVQENIEHNKKQQKQKKLDVEVVNVDIANVDSNKMTNIKQSNNNTGIVGIKSNRQSITIKGSRDMKVSMSDKKQQKIQRYQQQDDDLDVVQIGNNNNKKIDEKSNNKKIDNKVKEGESNNKIDRIKEDSKNVKKEDNRNDDRRDDSNNRQQINSTKRQGTIKDTKVSLTSLAEQVKRIQKNQKPTQNSIKSNNKQLQQYKQKQQHQKQQQEQEQQLHPADQLDYLICLVQNLGRYYNKSKQFYSLTQSSMVQIVMNHKLAAYYNSQQFYYYINYFITQLQESNKTQRFYTLSKEDIQIALQDDSILQAIEDLKSSIQVAKKLIKHTHQKAKIYLKKQDKQLQINQNNNYHSKCLSYVKQEFQGLYTLYQQRKSKTLAQRLCYLIQIYCILKSLNQQDSKQFQDLQDIGQDNYHQHIVQNKHFIIIQK